jgi:hypothetical protein
MKVRCEAWFEGLHRLSRRRIVAVGLLGYPVTVGVLALLKRTDLPRWWILAIFIALMMVTVAALVVAYGCARGRIDGHRVYLDERDMALREQAFVLGHRVLAFILVATVASIELYLTNGNTMRLDANAVLPVLMWIAIYIPALPSLMLTWIEPNAPVDA